MIPSSKVSFSMSIVLQQGGILSADNYLPSTGTANRTKQNRNFILLSLKPHKDQWKYEII